ncbi:type III secretion apparatus assembly protein SctX [Prosthecobacter dejongeii]|uniref:Uncharacterized protein n=1 Tax=Prosthecobacter dejongeii TaxID=48465 RepID=A0A7W8DQ95_9BACT|nr:hypothetical protein [Prosthecobacter dejongeii]MBB5037716.1 hypothetical protein [Prosthecobacter dejongeii]
MMQLTPEAFQPRVGLSSIELADESPHPLLPEDTHLQPINAAVERQLEAMLQAETFEKVVLDALRPQVQDQSVLHPSVFHPLRDQVMRSLLQEASQQEDPNILEELKAAINLLEHLGAVHDLGEQYRYALLKG